MYDALTYPDWVEWSKKLLDREDVAIALEQAFSQGKALGYRQGWKDGAEKGWQKHWDDDYAKKDV